MLWLLAQAQGNPWNQGPQNQSWLLALQGVAILLLVYVIIELRKRRNKKDGQDEEK